MHPLIIVRVARLRVASGNVALTPALTHVYRHHGEPGNFHQLTITQLNPTIAVKLCPHLWSAFPAQKPDDFVYFVDDRCRNGLGAGRPAIEDMVDVIDIFQKRTHVIANW